MQKGLSNQLTRQIGEHLAVSKLGRMGYIASPFAGNVPTFDILAADAIGHTIPIQVKAINGPSWQYQADLFLDIENIDGFQNVRGKTVLSNPDLICIYILLRPDERDEFFIFRLSDLQEITFRIYKSRKRPRNTNSKHCAVWPKHLQNFKNNWDLIKKTFHNQGK